MPRFFLFSFFCGYIIKIYRALKTHKNIYLASADFGFIIRSSLQRSDLSATGFF